MMSGRTVRSRPCVMWSARGVLTVFSCVVTMAAVVAPIACSRRSPRAQRIVLVTLDTLRWDAFFSASGEDRPMPHMVERTREGLVFERFYAASNVTQPSHAAMLTGRQPWSLGVVRNGVRLTDEADTVAEVLQDMGFETAAVVASFPVGRQFGFDQGFQHYVEVFSHGGGEDRRWEGHAMPEAGFFGIADEVADAACLTLDSLEGSRQFVWVHFFDPHAPYGDSTGAPAPSIRKVLARAARGEDVTQALASMRAGYARDVRFLDDQLERVLQRLEKDTREVDTWVIGASDHGESLGEGGSLGHGKRLSEEQVRVPPFIMHLGHRLNEEGSEPREDLVGSVDVAATILGRAGLELPIEGRDLLRPAGEPRRAMVFGMRRVFRSGATETRLDGSRIRVDRPLYFAVDTEGEMIIGSRDGIVTGDDTPTDVEDGGIVAAFTRIDDTVNAGPSDLPMDETTG